MGYQYASKEIIFKVYICWDIIYYCMPVTIESNFFCWQLSCPPAAWHSYKNFHPIYDCDICPNVAVKESETHLFLSLILKHPAKLKITFFPIKELHNIYEFEDCV